MAIKATKKTAKKPAVKSNGKPAVIVRTYSAGVHYGHLIKREGKEVHLSGSRRIHYWTGALSCSELATRGPGQGSRIGDPVEIELTEAIEIIQCAPAAAKAIEEYPRWERK
jgi:hypothetical protein